MATAPGDALLQAQANVVATDIGTRNGPAPRSFGIVLDGTVVSEHPLDAVTSGRARHTPMVMGTTRREVEAFVPDPETFAPDGLAGVVREVESWGVPAERAWAIVGAYRVPGRRPADVRAALLTDWIYRLPAARLAAAHRDRGGDAWLYTLDDAGHLAPAVHGADIPILFGTSNELPSAVPSTYPPGEEPRRRATGTDLRKRIAAFAHHGDPGWEPYEAGGGPALRIADAIDVQTAPALATVTVVVRRCLAGGVTRSPRVDPHGKTLSGHLLDMQVAWLGTRGRG